MHAVGSRRQGHTHISHGSRTGIRAIIKKGTAVVMVAILGQISSEGIVLEQLLTCDALCKTYNHGHGQDAGGGKVFNHVLCQS